MSNYNKIDEVKIENITTEIPFNIYNHVDNEEHICSICLVTGDTNDYISPCKCSGTSKYVHKKCIMKWINKTDNLESKKKCTVCKYEYKFIEINIQGQYLINIVMNNRFIFLFVVFNTLIFIISLDLYFNDFILDRQNKYNLYMGASIQFLFWIFLLIIHYCFLNNKSLFYNIFKNGIIQEYKHIYLLIVFVYIVLSLTSFLFYLVAIMCFCSIIITSFYIGLNELNTRIGRDILPYIDNDEDTHP